MRRFGSAVCVIALLLTSVAMADGQQIYWVQASFGEAKIRMCDTAGNVLSTALLAPGSLPQGLALHVRTSSLFWGSGAYVNAHIVRTPQTFSTSDPLPGGGSGSFIQGVALDTVAGKVYWTTSYVQLGCTVRRANLDGTGEDTLIAYAPNGIQNLRGIALDLQHHTMYWSDFGAGVIRSATLDGANVQDILTGLAGPVGIAVDAAGGSLYWCEANGHVIKRANLDGSLPSTIVSGIGSPQYIAVDHQSNMLVWTELGGYGHGKIRRAALDGARVQKLVGDRVQDGVEYPSGIAVLGSSPATSVEESRLPAEFALKQNYPNPFNPSTTIAYALPRPVHVNLSVYDILGRQVSLLVDEEKDAGVYAVKFDARGLASGVYIYRLHAGTFMEARGLVIAK
jgi:hypothetical protein